MVQDVAVGDLDLANIEKRFVRVEKDDDGDEEAEEAELIWDEMHVSSFVNHIHLFVFYFF